MLYSFFLVIPKRLNFMCRRFGTLFQFHRSCEQEEFSLFARPVKMKQTKCSESLNIKFRRWGITQKDEYNIHNTAKVY